MFRKGSAPLRDRLGRWSLIITNVVCVPRIFSHLGATVDESPVVYVHSGGGGIHVVYNMHGISPVNHGLPDLSLTAFCAAAGRPAVVDTVSADITTAMMAMPVAAGGHRGRRDRAAI